jgi:hypothetical protein
MSVRIPLGAMLGLHQEEDVLAAQDVDSQIVLEAMCALERAVLGTLPIQGVVLRYGLLYGRSTSSKEPMDRARCMPSPPLAPHYLPGRTDLQALTTSLTRTPSLRSRRLGYIWHGNQTQRLRAARPWSPRREAFTKIGVMSN